MLLVGHSSPPPAEEIPPLVPALVFSSSRCGRVAPVMLRMLLVVLGVIVLLLSC